MLGQAASMMMADGKMEESELTILRGIAARLGIGQAIGNWQRCPVDPGFLETSPQRFVDQVRVVEAGIIHLARLKSLGRGG